tara:strand:- start:3452 stop:3769 length:318 start_codon:yes stop_codon:yes gene_type:complete
MDDSKRNRKIFNYPKKVQWKEGNNFITYNLNTNKKKIFNKLQSGGINKGNTPAETIKIIEKQSKLPKTRKVVIGGLLLKVTSPEIVTIRKTKKNILKKFNFKFRR